jgi:hypothetical protein
VSLSVANSLEGKDLAYYYSNWIWPDGSIDFMKSMLLFFDGIALALPARLAAELIEKDPILAAPLSERGLLTNFDPVETLDEKSAEQLAVTLTAMLKIRRLWFKDHEYLNHEPVMEHWGEGRAPKAATTALRRALSKRGLIAPGIDGIFNMSHGSRLVILTVFAQQLRLQLARSGIALHCTTDSVESAEDFNAIMRAYFGIISYRDKLMSNIDSRDTLFGTTNRGIPQHYEDGKQFADDLRYVGADLSRIPLDEVLDFRRENGPRYRIYAANLREFLMSQAMLDSVQRQRAQIERAEEIRDSAAELRRLSRAAFGVRTGALLLSLAGAVWTVRGGDPFGALLTASSAGVQALPIPSQTVNAYSYLLSIRYLM